MDGFVAAREPRLAGTTVVVRSYARGITSVKHLIHRYGLISMGRFSCGADDGGRSGLACWCPNTGGKGDLGLVGHPLSPGGGGAQLGEPIC